MICVWFSLQESRNHALSKIKLIYWREIMGHNHCYVVTRMAKSLSTWIIAVVGSLSKEQIKEDTRYWWLFLKNVYMGIQSRKIENHSLLGRGFHKVSKTMMLVRYNCQRQENGSPLREKEHFSGFLFMIFFSSQKTWIHINKIICKAGNSFRTVTYRVTIISTGPSKNKNKYV